MGTREVLERRKTGTSKLVGVGLVSVSAVCFGAMPVFARAAYRAGAEPSSLLLLRFGFGGLFMLALLRLRGQRLPRARQTPPLVLLGGVGYVGQSLCYFTALILAPAGLVALLLYLYPALVTVLASLFLHERLTPTKLLALVTALVGTVLAVGPTGSGARSLGVVLGVGAALIYSVYILVGSRITPAAGVLPSAAVIMLSAAAVYAGVTAIEGPRFPTTATGWVATVAIALFSTAVAVTTFFAGVQRIGPSQASVLSTLEPAVTVVLAAVFLEEALGPGQVAGGGLILSAVVVLATSAAEGPGAEPG